MIGSPVLLLGVIAGAADIAGGLVPLWTASGHHHLRRLMSLGAGCLLGVAVFEILPKALKQAGGSPLLIAVGYFTLLLLEHARPGRSRSGRHAALAAVIGLLIHTFFDGAAMAVAFQGSPATGLLVFLPLVLHKLPEGFGLSAILLSAGVSHRHTVVALLAIGLSTVAGSWFGLQWGVDAPQLAGRFLAFSAGTFVYMGTGHLVHAKHSRLSTTIFVLIGAGAVFLLSHLLHRFGVL